MSTIRTYPEMNAKIVSLLRLSEDPMELYAAQLIEELTGDRNFWRTLAKSYADRIIAADKALNVEALPGRIIAVGEEKSGDLIQHVGYDEAQCGREK